MSKRYILAAVLMLGLVMPSVARATDDETARGIYSYKSSDLQLHFIFDLDGIRDLRINGKFFKGPIQVSEMTGSAHKTYTFYIVDRGITKTITLIVLFDSDDAVKGTAGFYYEHAVGQEQMTHAVTFQPTFRRINIEMLPSAQASN
jgi:hypothetical protein